MEVRFSYGALGDTLEEQANKQGLTLNKEAEILEKIKISILTCAFHVATPSQVSMMEKKLHKKVIDALEPIK